MGAAKIEKLYETPNNVVSFPGVSNKKKKTRHTGETKISTNGTVDPIKDTEFINMAKEFFLNEKTRYKNQNVRNYCLFVFSLNCARRISDTLQFKVKDVFKNDGEVRDFCFIKEKKTGKTSKVFFNEAIKEAMNLYYNTFECNPDDYLFSSRQDKNKPLTSRQVLNLYKKMADHIGLTAKGINIGTHSPRKTFVYQALQHSKDPYFITTLQKALNHSTPSMTLRYAGVEDEELEALYNNNEL